jgi:hypothetical protein
VALPRHPWSAALLVGPRGTPSKVERFAEEPATKLPRTLRRRQRGIGKGACAIVHLDPYPTLCYVKKHDHLRHLSPPNTLFTVYDSTLNLRFLNPAKTSRRRGLRLRSDADHSIASLARPAVRDPDLSHPFRRVLHTHSMPSGFSGLGKKHQIGSAASHQHLIHAQARPCLALVDRRNFGFPFAMPPPFSVFRPLRPEVNRRAPACPSMPLHRQLGPAGRILSVVVTSSLNSVSSSLSSTV